MGGGSKLKSEGGCRCTVANCDTNALSDTGESTMKEASLSLVCSSSIIIKELGETGERGVSNARIKLSGMAG